MKIVSVSSAIGEYERDLPELHFARMRAMPCEIVECTDIESVYQHAPSADVLFLAIATNCAPPPFWDEIAEYIECLSAFKVVFSVDSYRRTWPRGMTEIKFDAIVVSQYTAYKSQKFNYRCDHEFFSHTCLDVQDHGIAKDIDVFFWGNTGRDLYPLRNFMLRELTRYSALERIDGQLIINDIYLMNLASDRKRIYVRLPYHNVGYWGTSLYPLLERSWLTPTDSSHYHVPIARYVINAACGCVTMTDDFSDREALGFKHGENIWLTDEEHFVGDLTFLLNNDELVKEISANARKLVAERHTVKIRAMELYNFLQEVVK